MPKPTVVFFTANPEGTTRLKLDEEFREITAKFRAAKHRDSLDFESVWATRLDDLIQKLNEVENPAIVHFSGHGSPSAEIILLDADGQARPVGKDALANLFRVLGQKVRLVVLNACFMRPQAEAIAAVVGCAIGTSRSIGDRAAITFAASLYREIGFGKSVQTAFDVGLLALQLEDSPDAETPVLVCAPGIDPSQVVLVPDPQSPVVVGPGPQPAPPTTRPAKAVVWKAIARLNTGQIRELADACGIDLMYVGGADPFERAQNLYAEAQNRGKLPKLMDWLTTEFPGLFVA